MELHLVGIIIGVVVVISGSAIKQRLDSLCSSLVGDGLLGWSSGAITMTSAAKTRGKVGIVTTRGTVAVSSRTADLSSSLNGGGLPDWDNGIATTWAAVKLRNVIYGFKKLALASSGRHDLFLFRRDFQARRSGRKEDRKTDIEWYGLGNGKVSPTALFGAEKRKDECVRARATSGILIGLLRALPQ
jgi:hypothetical protein